MRMNGLVGWVCTAGTSIVIDLLIIAVWMSIDPPSGVILPSRKASLSLSLFPLSLLLCVLVFIPFVSVTNTLISMLCFVVLCLFGCCSQPKTSPHHLWRVVCKAHFPGG
jgi:hypothetical protein